MESYQSSSEEAVEHLIAMVVPRVRSIVNECVGQENSTGASFMSGGTTFTSTVKMNYNLDDSGYEMAQISEGYTTRQ